MRSVREDWPEIRPQPHVGACGCRGSGARCTARYVERLASQSLSTALRHAQDPLEEEVGATLRQLAFEAGRKSRARAPAGAGKGSSKPPQAITSGVQNVGG